jgi:hypothetical protein
MPQGNTKNFSAAFLYFDDLSALFGVPGDKAWQWANTRKGSWRIAGSWIPQTTLNNHCLETHGLTLFQGDSDLLPLWEGQMGIAFLLICARLDHNGITPFGEVVVNTIIRVLPFFGSPGMGRLYPPHTRATGLSVALQR